MKFRHFVFAAAAFLLVAQSAFGQIVSSNGWYFPKTPMSNVFGLPFINVEDKKKEATVSHGTQVPIDSASDISINTGFNYSKIFESSWREIILGSTLKNSKNVQLS